MSKQTYDFQSVNCIKDEKSEIIIWGKKEVEYFEKLYYIERRIYQVYNIIKETACHGYDHFDIYKECNAVNKQK